MAFVTKVLPVGVGRLMYNATPSALRSLATLDSVAEGGNWGAGWEDMSLTDGGITFRASKEESELTADQIMNPFLFLMTSQMVQLSTTLRAATIRNMAISSGFGSYTKVDAASGSTGHEEWRIDGNSTQVKDFCLGFEIRTVEGSPWRILLPIAHPTSNLEMAFAKGDTAKLNFEVRALEDTGVTPSLTCIARRVIPALA